MLITLPCCTAMLQSVAEVKLTSVSNLGAVSHIFNYRIYRYIYIFLFSHLSQLPKSRTFVHIYYLWTIKQITVIIFLSFLSFLFLFSCVGNYEYKLITNFSLYWQLLSPDFIEVHQRINNIIWNSGISSVNILMPI